MLQLFEQVLPEFIDFIGDDILVAHNSSFDNTMLYANMKRIGIDNITFPTIDTLKLLIISIIIV